MEFIVNHKWILLIMLEVAAWASTFFMLYARYGMQSSFWFKAGAVLFAITGVIPQVLLGLLNFIQFRELDLFTLIILLLLVIGFLSKKQVKKLDAWAQARFSANRRQH
ncbi:hypothetical protein ACHHV8_26940 [Paenibacillus sp. TAB 01]|uniref:hypothetical protein n=1 Tax=Paenibacillus sp. TAB 01 TaxID=3368988 RepID=UPI0037502D80